MKKTAVKKLIVSRETLRRLTEDQARAAEVQGGTSGLTIFTDPPVTSDSVRACCV